MGGAKQRQRLCMWLVRPFLFYYGRSQGIARIIAPVLCDDLSAFFAIAVTS